MKTLKLLLIVILFPVMLFAQNAKPATDEQKIINEINQVLYTDSAFKQPVSKEPNWKLIKKNISKKYKKVNSEKITNGVKIRYYAIKKDWSRFADVYLVNLEQYHKIEEISSYIELVSINNILYERIFKNVEDRGLLKRAAIQARKLIESPYSAKQGKTEESQRASLANLVDTYANLLYKARDIKEAIEWQRKAVEYSRQNKEFKTNLEKMEKGEKL